MGSYDKTKFQIQTDTHWKGTWQLGIFINIGRLEKITERYIFISFFKWTIAIGWLGYDEKNKGELK